MNGYAWLGAVAGLLTSLSYIPQVKKAWPRGATEDLSVWMLVVLTTGLVLWIVYGFSRGDWMIVGANSVGAALAGCVLSFKVRDLISR